MSGAPSHALLAFTCGCLLATALVCGAILVCRKKGWVAHPRVDRWHKSTPCFFGGVPLWAAFVLSCVFFVPFSNVLAWKVIGISSVVFALGLSDDIWHLKPRTKLLVQILAASLVLACGIVYPLTNSWWINATVSLVWVVGITNAFNLLDNMDGLSAGIAVIAAAYLALFYFSAGMPVYAAVVAVLAGNAAGFLIFNFNPARIFMGDAGSLFLGFVLGSFSLLGITHISGVPTLVFAPAAFLAIPIFDTFFVSVTRRLRGQRVSVGGTDHSSHRLVRLGLDERTAVLVLYGLSIGSGAVALTLRKLLLTQAVGLLGFWFLFLLLFGVHLFRSEQIHAHSHAAPKTGLRSFLTRDRLALAIDPLALSLSYYLAYFLRFRAAVSHETTVLFLRSWPLLLTIKFACLWWFRVYRGSWWRSSVSDVHRLAKAILTGEVLTLLSLTVLFRFDGYSRIVFALDGLLSFVMLLAVRNSFSLFRDSIEIWRPPVVRARRVFVLGTSERAGLAIRFLRESKIECAGLIDTNGGSDLGRRVWGMQVVGKIDDLGRLSRQLGVSEVVQPENESLPVSEEDFSRFCRHKSLQLTRLGLFPVSQNRNTEQKNVA